MIPESGGRRRPLPRWAVLAGAAAAAALVLIAVVVLVSQDSGRSGSSGTGGEFDLPPPPPDRGPSVSWLEDNGPVIDAFAAAAPTRTVAGSPACEADAKKLNDAVGSIGDYLRRVAGSPDPVLVELLGNNAQAARALLSACQAGDRDRVEEEREHLVEGLRIVEARRRQLGER